MNISRILFLATAAAALCSCSRSTPPEPPVATPSITINHSKAPLGSPLEITYRFVVAQNAPPFAENYRVFAAVVDADEEAMWNDDHNPSIPTTQWKPGQTIEYTRTTFVPIYPYIGDASIHMGLHSTTTRRRLPLAGDDVGQRAYRVAKLQLLPQAENVFTVFKEGWHPTEVAEHDASIEWQWTKKNATLSFRNPKKDCMFYLDVDNPSTVFPEGQHVRVTLGGHVLTEFELKPNDEPLRKIPISVAQLGSADMAELRIEVDKTFVPALLNAATNQDPRELGIRVLHAFVESR